MGPVFKVVFVSLTIAIGSLMTALWTGVTTEEDVQQWRIETGERIHSYVANEMGQFVAQQSAPLISSGLTLIGIVGYTLLFRKNRSEEPQKQSSTVHIVRTTYEPREGSLPLPVNESDTVKKAKARALKSQLISDKLNLQSKQERITHELLESNSAECKARSKRNSAVDHLRCMEEAYNKALKELETIKSEHHRNERDLQAINEEITKLNGLT